MPKIYKGPAAASAAAGFIRDLTKKAERLYLVRRDLATRDERFRKETEDLFREQSNLKAEVLNGLKLINLSSVKVRAGDTYFVSKHKIFEIKNPIAMTTWAIKNRIVRVDREALHVRLMQLAKNKRRIPDFVEPREIETISVRHKKNKILEKHESQ